MLKSKSSWTLFLFVLNNYLNQFDSVQINLTRKSDLEIYWCVLSNINCWWSYSPYCLLTECIQMLNASSYADKRKILTTYFKLFVLFGAISIRHFDWLWFIRKPTNIKHFSILKKNISEAKTFMITTCSVKKSKWQKFFSSNHIETKTHKKKE